MKRRRSGHPILAIRVDPEIYVAIENAVTGTGMTLSDWVRPVIENDCGRG